MAGMQVPELYDAKVACVAFFFENRVWGESYFELS
jgi:hypothetical protein